MSAKGESHLNFNSELLEFLGASPTPFHAARELTARLRAQGFSELREADRWGTLKAGAKHYVVRNRSSLVAFQVPDGELASVGFRLVGTHTDSPGLRVKPQPELESCGLLRLGVEVYGGVLLSTWFDRDLSLAGRVSYLDAQGRLAHTLVDFRRAIAILPNLAIHLNREVNENRSINKQAELPPLLCQLEPAEKNRSFRRVLQEELGRVNLEVSQVLDYELCFYDHQPAAVVGLKEEFISGARLDNLLSCFVGYKALCSASPHAGVVLVCNDHEEVGSGSTAGAQGPFLKTVLERLAGSGEAFVRAIDRSILVSADNAHGVHPSYPDRHDSRATPWLNHGPAIKINANQRYATTSETAALFAQLCEATEVPVQRFVARSDMPCGSTIGPITAALLGVRTVDVGVPTFAMHSIRETAGVRDAFWFYRVLTRFFSHDGELE